jgi:5-methylthioadenosine/S-adenosylhomocysteine deaminase
MAGTLTPAPAACNALSAARRQEEAMHDLLIENAIVVTGDAGFTIHRPGALAVRDGRIAAIGDVGSTDARERIDARGAILIPGLVNAHCHAADSLFRGLVEDLPLEPWLQTVWKAEAAILNPETCRLGATLGLAELALGGVTTVLDMFWHPRSTVAAARALGVRIATGGIFFDSPGTDGGDPAQRPDEAEAFFADYADAPDVIAGTFPHATYTVGPDSLQRAKAIANRHAALFHTHAAETEFEQQDITRRYGRSVIRHLDALGLLDPRTVLAHCVWLDDEEIGILARSGATVVHNPVSNLKLASGLARIPDLLAAGIPVALGTDGAISGNDLDLWMAMRLAAILHRGTTRRADAVTTRQAFAMATIEGARALGIADRIGSLEIGKEADMVLVAVDRVHAAPMFDPLTHLVFSTARSDVTDVWVAGEPVVRAGRLVRHDLGPTLAAVRALEPAIAASVA